MNLYKYFSEEGLLRFLQSFEVRFSPPYVFNDPFEGRPRLGLEGEWEQLAEQEQRIPRRSKKSTRRLPHRTRAEGIASFASELKVDASEGWIRLALDTAVGDRVGILCLSEEPLNILMWGHYADRFKGGTVEFDASNVFFSCERLPSGFVNILRKVEYQVSRPSLSLEFFKQYPAGALHTEGWLTLLADAHPLFYTKSPDWAYEKEWRLIRQLHSSESSLPDVAAAARRYDPAVDVESQIARIPPEAIRSITLGPMARRYQHTDSDGLEEAVSALLERNPAAEHVRVRKARLHEDEYRLVSFDLRNAREIQRNTSRAEQVWRRRGLVG